MAINRRHEMPQQLILFCEGIDFMGSFPIFYGNSYILLAIKFGVSRALISDQGNHFCNRAMYTLLEKYGVVHRVATTYHPQTNDQAEMLNREIKKLLQKMANPN
ncbi:hypothetical protein CR513_18512, partial [Mucuna pruriens]